jgi:N-carbamoylputrescine amidase
VNDLKFRIGLVQMQCSLDLDQNLTKAEDRCRQAAASGAQIVCLPELFRSQYFCREEDARLFDLAEPIPGPSTERLSSIARHENVVIIASLFERRAPGVYHNTVAVIGTEGEILGL